MFLSCLCYFIPLVLITATLGFSSIWTMISNCRKSRIPIKVQPSSGGITQRDSESPTKPPTPLPRSIFGSPKPSHIMSSSHVGSSEDDDDVIYFQDAEDDSSAGPVTPDWVSAPRDASSLYNIIASTKSNQEDLCEYAFSEMIKIMERMQPSTENYERLMKAAFDVVVEWTKLPVVPSNVNRGPGAVLDPLPFLVETASQLPCFSCYFEELIQYLVRSLYGQDAFRHQAVFAVGVLLERQRLPQEVLRDVIIPHLFDLVSHCEEEDGEHRVEIATVLCRVVSCDAISDRGWIFDNYIARYSHFLRHPTVHVRKAAISIFADLCNLFGERFVEAFIVPHIVSLSEDSNWGVRKAICEVFVRIAKYSSKQTRFKVLSPRFVKLLHDSSRWVNTAAYQDLGHFISTFYDHSVTGLSIMDSQICEMGTPMSDDEPMVSSYSFERFPPGTFVPAAEESTNSEETSDSYVNGLHSMLTSWSTAQKSGSTSTDPFVSSSSDDGVNRSAASKCGSYENLSNLGLFDEDMCDSDGEMDTTVLDYSDEDSMEEDLSPSKSEQKDNNGTSGIDKEMDELSMGFKFWANDASAFDIDSEELVAFGSAPKVREDVSSGFLDRRYDVLHLPPPKSRSTSCCVPPSSVPVSAGPDASVSPARKDLAYIWQDTTPPQPERDSLYSTISMDTESELFKDCRGTDEEEEEQMEHDQLVAQKHVPRELIDNFLSMVSPSSNDSEIIRYCAYSFPAVAFTLGGAGWPQLRNAYFKLASDDQSRVRLSIASSIHEIAAIVGPDITDDDLLPIFNQFRTDVAEVRGGVLQNLYKFFKCLTPVTRKAMIEVLPQFMPIENDQSYNWRFREQFSRQCKELCGLYGVEEINSTISAIALTLSIDHVHAVRLEAVRLISHILGRLLAHEWPLVGTESSDHQVAAELTDLFVQDIVSGFAKSQKWRRRQTFAFICEQVLVDKTMTGEQFRYFFLAIIFALASDAVSNVRVAVARVMAHLDFSLFPQPVGKETTQSVSDVVLRLVGDTDMDVAREARSSADWSHSPEFVDCWDRDARIKKREDLLFEAKLPKDDYEVTDMNISDSASSTDA